MPRRKSNLGRRTRKAEAVRRTIVNRTEEERASAHERHRERMAQIRSEETAERRAARLEDARLRARRSRSAASKLLRSQKNERERLRVAERRQRKTADQRQTQLRAQQPCIEMVRNYKKKESAQRLVYSQEDVTSGNCNTVSSSFQPFVGESVKNEVDYEDYIENEDGKIKTEVFEDEDNYESNFEFIEVDNFDLEKEDHIPDHDFDEKEENVFRSLEN